MASSHNSRPDPHVRSPTETEAEESIDATASVWGLDLTASAWSRLLHSPRGRGLRALRHRSFSVLWLSLLVGQIGFWISNVSLQWTVARMSGNDSFMLGLLFFFNFLPLMLFTPIGGMVADHFDRKRLVIVAQLGLAFMAFVLVLVTLREGVGLPVIFACAFGFGSAMSLNAPASQAVVANSVPESDLSSAVSIQSVGLNFSRVAGPMLATPVLALWGATPAFAIYSGACLFTALALTRVRLRVVDFERSVDRGVLGRMKAGFLHARQRRPALLILSMVAVTAVFGGSYIALLPVFGFTVLNKGDAGFTMLVVATGFGAMVGAFTTGYRETPAELKGAALKMLGTAVALVAFSMSKSFVLSLAIAAIAGGFNFATMTTLNTMLQHLVDEDKRGRVMSLYVMCWGGLIPIGGLLIGIAARFGGPGVAVGGFALVCLAYSLVVLGRMPSLRRLQVPLSG